MLERRDVEERIAEIKGKRNQTESECMKLAAYIIIRDDFDKSTGGSYGDAAPAPVKPTAEAVIGIPAGDSGEGCVGCMAGTGRGYGIPAAYGAAAICRNNQEAQ